MVISLYHANRLARRFPAFRQMTHKLAVTSEGELKRYCPANGIDFRCVR